jgi:inner membrane protein
VYRTGHYGAALLAFTPLQGALLVLDRPDLAVVSGMVVLALARLPDYDLKVPLLTHRGPTHTFGFALLVGLVVGTVGLLLGRPLNVDTALALGGLGFTAGTLSILSHLAADVITPAGITPVWPLSDRNFSLDLVGASNTVANWVLLVLGVFATVTLFLAASIK